MRWVAWSKGVGAESADSLSLLPAMFSLPSLPENWLGWLFLCGLLAASLAFVYRSSSKLLERFEEVVFTNWRLALLGATGIVLSLASGWTTWDGMRNFTGEPVLSFMVTFGIQGVMLIVAWLIGESFATGMSAVRQSKRGFTAAVSGLVMPYFLVLRIIMANIVLWVMFLACMATSVFFSFDSLFSTIFPLAERERAAQLRAQNQISGLVAELGDTIATERLRQAQGLFATESWQTYSAGLDGVAEKALAAQDDLRAHFRKRVEANRQAVAEQQERQSTAASQQAALRARKTRIAEELSRLQAARPGSVGEVTQQEDTVRSLERELEAQTARVLAEEKGVGGSGRAGRGSKWRAQKALEEKLTSEVEIERQKLETRRERLTEIDEGIARIKSELATLDGELAKLLGQVLTAKELISAAEKRKAADTERVADPINVLPAFERARTRFREEPTSTALDQLQSSCLEVLAGLAATGTEKGRGTEDRCDTKKVAELAAPLFALNAGVASFNENCASGELIEAQPSTNALFKFLRQCLSNSGLPSEQTRDLRNKINFAELNRDDRAHRFVVTWNAFTDGNRLAYLALAIAIAIDSLVFMAGLFGANVVRSPLQDVPNRKLRSARHLEEIIDNALLPNRYVSACATLDAMKPIDAEDGFTQEIVRDRIPAGHHDKVNKVLNAGAAIGAVQRLDNNNDHARIRSEMFEYLSIVAKREVESNREHIEIAELEPAISHALHPKVGENAQTVLKSLTPYTPPREAKAKATTLRAKQKPDNDTARFSAVLELGRAEDEDLPILNNFLITGAAHGMIDKLAEPPEAATANPPAALDALAEASPAPPASTDYLIDRILHKALLSVARAHPIMAEAPALQHAANAVAVQDDMPDQRAQSTAQPLQNERAPASADTPQLGGNGSADNANGGAKAVEVTLPPVPLIRREARSNDVPALTASVPTPTPAPPARAERSAMTEPAPHPQPVADIPPEGETPDAPPEDPADGIVGYEVALDAFALNGEAAGAKSKADDSPSAPGTGSILERAGAENGPAGGLIAPEGLRPEPMPLDDEEAEREALRAELIEHYVPFLDFPREIIDDILRLGPEVDVDALNEILDQIVPHEEELEDAVSQFGHNFTEAMAKAEQSLPQKLAAQPGTEAALEALKADLVEYRVMLLVSPQGAYRNRIWEIRRELSEMRGNVLDAERIERELSVVNKHYAQMARADLSTATGWHEVKVSLAAFERYLSDMMEDAPVSAVQNA